MTKKLKNMLTFSSLIFIIGALVTIPLAVYLILYEIDPETHFYYDSAKFVNVQNSVLLISTVLLILPAFSKRTKKMNYECTRNWATAVCSVLFAIAICISSAHSILQTFRRETGAGGFITGLAGFLAAIFFFTFADSIFRKKHADLRILALLPVVWGVVNLITTFMSLTQIANISEYLYEVMQMVFAILFLYYNARLIGGVPNGRELQGVFAYGLPCTLFGLLSSLPPVIAHLINNKRGSVFGPSDAVYITASAYILVLLISLLKEVRQKKAEEPKPEVEDNKE